MSEFKEFVPRSNSGVAPQLSAVYVPACPAPAGHTIQHLQLPRPSNVACVGVMAVEVVFAPNLCVSLWPQYVRTRSTCPPPQHLRSVSCRAIVVDVHDIPLGALKDAKNQQKIHLLQRMDSKLEFWPNASHRCLPFCPRTRRAIPTLFPWPTRSYSSDTFSRGTAHPHCELCVAGCSSARILAVTQSSSIYSELRWSGRRSCSAQRRGRSWWWWCRRVGLRGVRRSAGESSFPPSFALPCTSRIDGISRWQATTCHRSTACATTALPVSRPSWRWCRAQHSSTLHDPIASPLFKLQLHRSKHDANQKRL